MSRFQAKVVFLLLALSLLFIPNPLRAAEEPKVEGVYMRLQSHPFKFDGKQVEVLEFLSFYCSHCYHFENEIPIIRGNFPKKITWKVMPVYWGKGSSKPGEAYLLAEEAGMGDKMKAALFNAEFVEQANIGNVEVLERIGAKLGLGFDFSKRLRSGEKAKEAQRAMELAKEYGVSETPTLVVSGNLMTTASMTGGEMGAFTQNVISMVKSILK